MNQLLMQMLWLIPTFVVGIVGLVLAITKWQRHPQASLLITLGLGVLLTAAVLQMATYSFIIPRFLATRQPASLPVIYGVVNFLFALLHQSGILLLILGAFANRKPQSPPPMR